MNSANQSTRGYHGQRRDGGERVHSYANVNAKQALLEAADARNLASTAVAISALSLLIALVSLFWR